ncbi:MAG: hypothetical protein IBX69_15625 [Anaerolineales bacterium]|nr:hypothetical protein [Anaerolineales bacterium]
MTPFSHRKESPSPITVRLPKVARRQLDELAELWGENQSQAIIRCLERAWATEIGSQGKSVKTRSVLYKENIMSTKITSIHSIDGSIELALYPASVMIHLTDEAARQFDEAIEKEKTATWLPIWKQIKGALLTAGQYIGHRFADKLLDIPLEAIVEISMDDGRLQLMTERGNEVHGTYNLEVGDFHLDISPGAQGVFTEDDVQSFARRYAQVKPLYLEYLGKLGIS